MTRQERVERAGVKVQAALEEFDVTLSARVVYMDGRLVSAFVIIPAEDEDNESRPSIH